MASKPERSCLTQVAGKQRPDVTFARSRRRAADHLGADRVTKILIADDERDIRELIGFTLHFAGFEVVLTADGIEAIEKAPVEQPDLVLLDVRMPKMTGYEVCRQLRENPLTRGIPVVFLSAKGQEGEILGGLTSGALEYWVKPFTADGLTAQVNDILRGCRLGIYEEDLTVRGGPMCDSAQMEDDMQFLVNEIKRMRKNRKDLVNQLIECRERAEASSDQQSPLAELSRLTDGIVHDMRSGLGVIRNTIGFLEDDLAESDNRSDLLKITRSLDFCELVLRNLSALGGQDIFQPQSVNLEEVVREVYFMLERKLVDVDLVVDGDPDAPEILADAGQMRQVFMNLIKNAGEAMPDGGTLAVHTRREGPMLRVEVADTGCGISPENQARLFHEFFTTKDRGYGLGLHIVDTIVKRHGGTIEVESQVGEGTTFTLRLPIETE
jgi:two-component system NtrC family sensor kinase